MCSPEDPKFGDGHSSSEERARWLVCHYCGYDTDRKNNLKRHIQTMHEAAPVELECCGQRFFNKADLRAHTRALHRNGYMCPVCRHVFCRKALLKRHLSVHTGIKDFICCFCGYDTSHKSNLERHMRTHAKVQEEPSPPRKVVACVEASRPAMAPEPVLRRGSLPGRVAPKAMPDTLPRKIGGWPWAWALPPRPQQSPPLSPPPPPLLPCPAESRPQPARHPGPQRSFTIEALLQKDSEHSSPAGPSQGRFLALVDVRAMGGPFCPPPPPLSITPPYQISALPHAYMSLRPNAALPTQVSPPPLQCVANPVPHASSSDRNSLSAFKITPSPESPARESSPEMVSSPEEYHRAEGEEYVHKKLSHGQAPPEDLQQQQCGGWRGAVAGGGDVQYSQIGGSDSDDSRSSISRSEDTDGVPGITYTSDDSAEVVPSDSSGGVDSDAIGYIGGSVQMQDDEVSQRLLLDSGCPSPSPQPSPQPVPGFTLTHPLATMAFTTGPDCNVGLANDPQLGLPEDTTGHHGYAELTNVGPHQEVRPFERSSSLSSSSSGSSPGVQQPLLLPDYQPLPTDFPLHHHHHHHLHFTSLEYEPLDDQHPPLSPTSAAAVAAKKMPFLKRCVIGGSVHISSRYKDAFYVKWNWPRIRQTCVLLNVSVLLALLCVGVGLLVQMPRGGECDPEHAWWQGSVMYEVFVPSFHDSDGDGVGDLPGLIDRLDYIQSLGVRSVRLASVLEATDYLDSHTAVANYTAVEPLLGTLEDLRALATHLHQRDMYLLMDIPLAQATGEKVMSLAWVSPVLKHWLALGVDGFHFPDLTQLAGDPGLVEALHGWRGILDQYSHGSEHRVMMAPVELLDTLQANTFPHLDHLIRQLDLIDVTLNLTGSAKSIPEVVKGATAWDSHASLPWINWNMGGTGKQRVASLTDLHPLGRSLVLLFLPGTITLYYGDELDSLNAAPQDNGWSSVMAWNSEAHAGFSSVDPWRPLNSGWEDDNVDDQNDTITALSTMVWARQKKVPIYINGIFDYKGDYHPTKTANYRVRHAGEDLLIMDRFFPRRNGYALVANLGDYAINKDLSHFYFGGSVLASSHGHTGFVTFHNMSLQPGEALVCILDL
ncbi:Glucan 1,6-alpha-glucosidase [Chionoecetes opilio]|uniref:Glucan 1,6-alpha-glucosidase n=1 Tax=Chionoecetes opilio TaxID=41210 RepID=A0A8J5BX66_CHIOP|nr:Glucan 1,6-alpha-glucosidase [Chionoecetes opilio]